MTEAEWLACTDPTPMLEFLRGKASDRKLRLFAVACCRRLWHLMTDAQSRHAVEIAERLADGLATNAERRAAAVAGYDPSMERRGWSFGAAGCAVGVRALHAAVRGSGNAAHLAAEAIPLSLAGNTNPAYWQAYDTERKHQTPLLRDIFGNPSRPVYIDPAWLAWNDGTVRNIAQAIYDEHAFDRMPILADALEESSCTDADILNHCRQPGEHARGCWVVDAILGKQ